MSGFFKSLFEKKTALASEESLPEGWSDHTRRGARVKVMTKKDSKDYNYSQEVASFLIGTWNLQDQCVSTKTAHTQGRAHGNTPLEFDELGGEYQNRKNKQISTILEILKKGDIDILFLQEIDFLVKADKAFKPLKDSLVVELKKLGYDIIITPAPARIEPAPPAQQALATIYKTTRLTPVQSQGVFLSPDPRKDQGKYRGFETTFTILNNPALKDTPLVATNIHLLYNHDYQAAFTEHEQKLCPAPGTTRPLNVLGGDSNGAGLMKGAELFFPIDYTIATNVSSKDRTLTTQHDERAKAYDVLTAGAPRSPEDREKYLVIISNDPEISEQLRIDPTLKKGKQLCFEKDQEVREYRSLPGCPWEKSKTAIDRETTRYLTAPEEAVRAIAKIIAIKQLPTEIWQRQLLPFCTQQKSGQLIHLITKALKTPEALFEVEPNVNIVAAAAAAEVVLETSQENHPRVCTPILDATAATEGAAAASETASAGLPG